jgi:hypothetical protein
MAGSVMDDSTIQGRTSFVRLYYGGYVLTLTPFVPLLK